MSIAASRKRYMVYDTDFQANVLDVASTLGYAIPSFNKRVRLNKRMKDLKNTGKFQTADCIGNYALNNTALWQFSLIDWKKQGVLHTIFGGMTYTLYGWEGNGVDGYISTQFNPAVGTNNYTLNNAAFGATVYKAPLSTGNFISSAGGGFSNILRLTSGVQQRVNATTNNISPSVNLSGTGLRYLARVSSSVLYIINKDIKTQHTQNSTGIANLVQRVLNGGNTYSDAGVSDFMMGGFTPAIIQADRIATNEYLQRIGLNPIA